MVTGLHSSPFNKQFAQRLYVACLRIVGNVPEAEEAMQDSFLKIFTRLDQYRDGQCFEAWMHRIAVHTAIDYVRRQTPDWEELSDDYTEPDDDGRMRKKSVIRLPK